MYPGSLPYALPLAVAVLLTGGIAIYAFNRTKHTGALTFGWLASAMTVWSLSYGFELLAPDLPGKILAAKLEYLGISLVPVFWFLFALEYTGHQAWLGWRRRLALLVIPALTLCLVFTNEENLLIYRAVGLDPQGYPPLVILEYGWWFWVHVGFSYSLILAGMALYLVSHFQVQPHLRPQISIMLLGASIPLLVNALRLFTPLNWHGFDLTPYAFAFSGTLLALGLFRFSLINLGPIAASLVMENLRDAVIVLDNSKRIVALNLTAQRWLGVGKEALGQSALAALGPAEIVQRYWDVPQAQVQVEIGQGEERRCLNLSISPLCDARGKTRGRVVVARDVTREQTLLMSEKRRVRQLEVLSSITHASLEALTFHELLQTLAERLGELFEADGTFITLWDAGEQSARPGAANGELRETYPAMKFDPGEVTLTASVLQAGHPLPVEDVFNSPYISPTIAESFPSRSLLGLPLIALGEKLGAALIAFNQPHRFTEQEISIGQQAAAQIALALSKAQLLENISRRVVQMGLVEVVSRQMAESQDQIEICQKTVSAMISAFGYDQVVISLLVEGNQLELVAIDGVIDLGYNLGFRQAVGQGIMGHVAEIRQPYFTKDITQDPYYYHPRGEGIGLAMAVPILHEDTLLGVLYVQSAPPHTITLEDLQILQTLASYLVTAIQKARFHADVREHLVSITTLQSITQTVNSSLELDNIFKTVVQLLRETYGYAFVSIYLLEGSTLRLGAQAGYPEGLIIHEIPVSQGVSGRTVRTRQPQFVRNVKADATFLMASYEVENEICVPLLKNELVLGTLNIESNASRPLTEKDLALMIALAAPVALAIDNARLHAKITSLALTDGLTGLANRRAFDQVFELEIARALRYHHPLALIMIDIDSFKTYNDTFGHPAGDERLKAIAQILLTNVRDPDLAARYGGEELVILLPHTEQTGALALAERLRACAAEQAPNQSEIGLPVPGYTLSLGVAVFPADGETPAELLRAADTAELTAKRLGKNRVCSADGSVIRLPHDPRTNHSKNR